MPYSVYSSKEYFFKYYVLIFSALLLWMTKCNQNSSLVNNSPFISFTNIRYRLISAKIIIKNTEILSVPLHKSEKYFITVSVTARNKAFFLYQTSCLSKPRDFNTSFFDFSQALYFLKEYFSRKGCFKFLEKICSAVGCHWQL